jgi:hypothetical protein
MKRVSGILPAIALVACCVACNNEHTSSTTERTDTMSTTAPVVTNPAPDTARLVQDSGMNGTVKENSNASAANAAAGGSNAGHGATMTSGHRAAGNTARETRESSAGTAELISPHATTVLRGEKTGATPPGVKKGRDYIPRDSVNNRTGLAPPR